MNITRFMPVAAVVLLAAQSATAQRKPSEGKPDLSGIWAPEPVLSIRAKAEAR